MNHDKQNNRTNNSDGVPTFLAIHNAIWNNDMQRIIPHLACEFERHQMLYPVAPSLFGIPFKCHFIRY